MVAPPVEPSSPPFELPALGDLPPSPAPPSASPFGPASFAPQEFETPSAPAPPPTTREAFVEEPVSQRYFDAAAEPAAEDDVAVIRMKPLDEPRERDEFRSAWSEDGSVVDEEDGDARPGGFDATTLTVLERIGGFLSRILSPLAPAADRLTSRRQANDAEDSEEVDDAADEEPDEQPDEEPDDEPEDLEPAGPTLLQRLSGWAGGLRERFRRSEATDDDEVDEEEDEEEDEDEKDEVEQDDDADEDDAEVEERGDPSYDLAPARAPSPAVPERMVVPPKPATELPVVPFKASPEPRRQPEFVYGDDEPSRFWAFLAPVWSWLKLIVTTGVLVAAVAYAWIERSKWLPRAADLGQSMFSEIDRQVLSRTRREERQKALGTAGEKLPQLAPATIALVFSRNPMGVEEASEVFQIAREAAERGAPTLPPAEAEELKALESELMAGLSRMEQERVREYDRTRARRVIFPFENPHVMDLVARGARSLPAERRARLQALLEKAVAAGLALPPAAPTDAPPG